MNNEMLQEILKYLDKIGEQLGVGAGRVWPWMLKEQVVSFWTSVIFVFVFGVISGVFLFVALKTGVEEWFWICGFLSVVFFVAVVNLIWSVPQVLNPEYYALRDLLSMVKTRG